MCVVACKQVKLSHHMTRAIPELLYIPGPGVCELVLVVQEQYEQDPVLPRNPWVA